MANLVVAYIYWFLGGIFGLHQFYLGRDKHAFVWWLSNGGYVLGWLRDLWRIPDYVSEANQDPGYISEFTARRIRNANPRFCFSRFIGQVLIGAKLGYLCVRAVPEEMLTKPWYGYVLQKVLSILGAAVGVYLVANIGNRKVSMKFCLQEAAVCAGVMMVFLSFHGRILSWYEIALWVALPISICASYKAEWDTKTERKNGFKRVLVLALFGSIYMGLWCSGVYHNDYVLTADGTYVPVREAVPNFFKSPAWREFRNELGNLFRFCWEHGWDNCHWRFKEKIDPLGELNAYKVLEFDNEKPNSEDEIQSRCRKLSGKWHPDKFRGDAEKAEAQERFIEIQQACDVLSNLRKNRAKHNMRYMTKTANEHYWQDWHPDL